MDLSGIYMKVNKSVLSDPLDDYTLCLDVVNKAVSKLKTEKQDGGKGLWSNLVINAPVSWKNMLKALIQSMIIHGHYAQELLLSTLSSLPKNDLGDLCDSDNYRGIALTSCLNKAIDWVILFKYRDQLHTSHMQFAYKENHSTSMCTMALKEVVKYYSLRRGQVYCCLLDASKAFDRVRFDKLFQMLLQRNLPGCIIRLLLDMYSRQRNRTVWEGRFSQQFPSANGVRQGGVLSPILFIVYVDTLLSRLESSGFGSFVGDEYLAPCVMPMISHYWLLLSPHWNQWSKYVKNLAKSSISPLMQVKPFVYTFLGNDVIVKIHPHYIWMTKPCPGLKA